MEKTVNGEIDLNNIIMAVWKRRKLIIVLTFVCMVAGGIIMNFRSSVTYRSDAVIKMGKKVEYKELSASAATPSVTCSEESADPEKAICIKYDPGNKENSRYSIDAEIIDAEIIDASPMIRVIINGTDRGTEKVLNEIVNRLIDDYNKIEEASVTQYKDVVVGLEAGAKVIHDNMAITDGKLKEVESMDNAALDRMAVELTREETVKSADIYVVDVLQHAMEALDRRINRNERHLDKYKSSLGKIQQELIVHHTFLRSLNGYNTKLIGEVKNSVVEPKKMRGVLMCGVIGLALSLFLVFILECVRARVEKKKNLA